MITIHKGDLVTRKKYENDIVFVVSDIVENIYYLHGLNVRLCADTNEDDLVIYNVKDNKSFFYEREVDKLDKNEYFYILPSILHIDSDKNYANQCEIYYKQNNVKHFIYIDNEENYTSKIINLLKKFNPDILVITGHDAYYKVIKSNENYKNSNYFIDTVKTVRKVYKNHNDLVIIAGACQSNYIGLIGAGATFASSPNHVNIHALDPSIIAVNIAFTYINESINIKNLLNKTVYKNGGFGGLIINGKMQKGYPRKEAYESI